MGECVADPSTTARWSAAMQSDKIVPQWNLRQSCLSKVKDSVLGYSRGRRNSVSAKCPVENPFCEYPMDLRQELLDNLLRLKPTGRELLKAAELLVCSGLQKFDLGCFDDCKFEDVRGIIEILIRTGACLEELCIAGQWLYQDASNTLIYRMLQTCPNLLYLRLQHTTIDSWELEQVLKNCPKLRKLEICHPSVEEEDFISLDLVMRDNPKFDEVRKNLTEIKLPSSVNGRGILKLLEIFPNLQYITFTFLDEVIDELEGIEDESKVNWFRERTSKIYGIEVWQPSSEDTVEFLVKWFPNLEEVSLEVQESMDLQPLANLSKLRSLELKNSPTIQLSYIEEVIPLLSKCGQKLFTLSLERFDLIDLAKTTTYCPNLRSFSAQWFLLLCATVPRGTKQTFLNLRYLRLRPRVNRRVNPDSCELLLTNSTRLKHLEFYSSYGLTDCLITKLLKTNKFPKLRSLLLRHGHGLSSSGILQLTRSTKNLRIWDVGEIYTKQANT